MKPAMTRNDPKRVLNSKVTLARAAILFEDIWHAIWPATMVAGIAALALLSGLAARLPLEARIVGAAILLIAFGWALRPLLAVRMPDRQQALRRIETRSGLKHRPATGIEDRLAGENPTPRMRAVWQVHRQRLAAKLRNLKFGWPQSDIARRDPFALRNALAIALVAAAFLGASQWRGNLAASISTGAGASGTPATFDAWITPPGYTGRAPILLTSEAARKRAADGRSFVVPQNSSLVVRLNGAAAPNLQIIDPDAKPVTGDTPEAARIAIRETGAGGIHEHRTKLTKPAMIVLADATGELARWPVAIVPDKPPSVEITGNIEPTATGSFAIPWKAGDDYGVAGIRAIFALVDKPKTAEAGARPPLAYPAPGNPVNMRKINPREAAGRSFQDLTAHPWAGLKVSLTLKATDQAGQTTESEPLVFNLPQRNFRKLLARALVEQRRNIVNRPDEKQNAVRALAALLAWPKGLVETSGVYLGIRTTASDLYRARSDDALKASVKQMWELAILIEDGDLSSALKELSELRKQLQKALAENAPPGKIAELMSKLREAMDRYLEAMARQMQRAMRNGDRMQQARPGQQIRSMDLKRMLDQIENLARQGSRDAAQEMLSQLENLMRNLRMARPGQMDPQRQPPMARMLQELTEMMRRQRDLMDRTQRMQQHRYGQNFLNQQRPQNGQRGNRRGQRQPGNQQGGQQLSRDQSQLGKMLEDMLKQLERQGLNAPKGLGRSRQAMEGAAEALGQGEKGRALGRQGEALEGLRQGARQMAQNLMQQGTGNEGNYGRHGEARGDQRDPLGRPMPRTGEDRGPDKNMLPTESAIQRAREILDLLRRHSNNPERPRLELDYFERLLRGLY